MANQSAIQQIQCPNCGAALSQYSAGTQTIICSSCGSYVAIGTETPDIIGKSRKLPKPSAPIEIGSSLQLDNITYQVLGRVVYMGWDDEDRWQWDEWMLGSPDGRMIWLSYDETGFGLFTKKRFREQFNAQRDAILSMGELRVPIHERYPAKIVGAEGELTWRVQEGERLYIAEGAKNGKKYSIQQTDEEMEVYEGKKVSPLEIAKAFNDPKFVRRVQSRINRAQNMKIMGQLSILFAIVGIAMAIATSAIGEQIQELTVPLRPNTPTEVKVDFNQAGRPAVVDFQLSGSLPENTFLDIDLDMIAPDETESYLFSKSFWHETGYDDEGFWRDVRTNGSGMFVPLSTGVHRLKVTIDPASTYTGDVSALVSIRRNIWVAQWFIAYAVLSGIMGVLIWMSAPNPNRL